jgi:hypothetical protein
MSYKCNEYHEALPEFTLFLSLFRGTRIAIRVNPKDDRFKMEKHKKSA